MSGSFFGAQTTRGGYRFDECTSSMQKCIRRGLEREAIHWAIEIESVQATYLWNRLEVIANEDIGIANPQAIILIYVMKQQYLDARKRGNDATRLMLANAILTLCRSPKSRLADNFCIVAYCGEDHLEVPDYGLDKHTQRGRSLKRGIEHFVEDGTKVDHLAFEDIYRDEAVQLLKDKRPWRYATVAGKRAQTTMSLGDAHGEQGSS